MGSWSDISSDRRAKVARRPSSNYRVRFRHNVYPNAEGEATRADIKKYGYFFSGGQTWVATSGQVIDFIDESDQVAAELQTVERRASGEGGRRPTRRLLQTRTPEEIPLGASHGREHASEMSVRLAPYAAVGTVSSSAAPSTASSSPRQAVFAHRRHTSPAPSPISSHDGSSSIDWQYDAPTSGGPFPASHTTRVPWPLSDPVEARLFRFWVDTAAQWWDITSSHNVFKEVVPQLALTNSMLLNAIFMIACQHIRRYDASFPAKPFLYHERVLQQLIPYLAENGRIQDEATLVAAIFLRGFEELHAGTRGQYHLSTYELFHGRDGWLFNMSSPVVQACFMVHVHFEVYQGLLNQPSLRVDYRTCPLPDLSSPIDDAAWGNKIVWTCAQILQWVQSGSRRLSDWQRLHSMVDRWERDRPSRFNAFFYRDADLAGGRHLPELWFPNICHADAHQHLRICRIALAVSKPDTGAHHAQGSESENASERQIAEWLTEMIGVARSNPHAVSAPSVAAHAMHSYAGRMREPLEQSNVMQFLEEVDNMGWSTEITRQWLRLEWGWVLREEPERSIEGLM